MVCYPSNRDGSFQGEDGIRTRNFGKPSVLGPKVRDVYRYAIPPPKVWRKRVWAIVDPTEKLVFLPRSKLRHLSWHSIYPKNICKFCVRISHANYFFPHPPFCQCVNPYTRISIGKMRNSCTRILFRTRERNFFLRMRFFHAVSVANFLPPCIA